MIRLKKTFSIGKFQVVISIILNSQVKSKQRWDTRRKCKILYIFFWLQKTTLKTTFTPNHISSNPQTSKFLHIFKPWGFSVSKIEGSIAYWITARSEIFLPFFIQFPFNHKLCVLLRATLTHPPPLEFWVKIYHIDCYCFGWSNDLSD